MHGYTRNIYVLYVQSVCTIPILFLVLQILHSIITTVILGTFRHINVSPILSSSGTLHDVVVTKGSLNDLRHVLRKKEKSQGNECLLEISGIPVKEIGNLENIYIS